MSKRDKRLQKIRDNPKNVSFDDLQTVMLSFGFILDPVTGSHHTFYLEKDDEKKIIPIPFRRPVKPVYVRQAIQLIEQYVLVEDDDDE